MINLSFKHATGSMFRAKCDDPKKAADPKQPKLEGFAELSMSDDESRDGPKLRVSMAAWLKETKATADKPSRVYYSVSIGGYLNGSLFPETDKRSPDSPDYTGTLGENRELRMVGWKQVANGTNQGYLSVLVSLPQSGTRARTKTREAEFI